MNKNTRENFIRQCNRRELAKFIANVVLYDDLDDRLRQPDVIEGGESAIIAETERWLTEPCDAVKGERIRGFELCSHAIDAKLPQRSTKNAAGYDFFARENVVIFPKSIQIAWTGIKAYMPPNEVLKLYNRSSNPKKRNLMLANGVGVVDADYYNNADNEGDIGFMFYNFSDEPVMIEKGDKIGQGVFETFALADNDATTGVRSGGFGSTGK